MSLEDSFTAFPFTIRLTLKGEEKAFKRQVYSLLDMIGDVGGLYDGLLFITGFIISSYNATMHHAALVSSLFKF